MENILYVHQVKAVLLYSREKISIIIVIEFKEYQALLIVFLKLIKILYFQVLRMVLSEELDLNPIKLFKLSVSIKKMTISQLNHCRFLIVEILLHQQVTTTQSNFTISVSLLKEDKIKK